MRTLGPQGGALLIALICSFVVGSNPAEAQTSTLPAGWTNSDIGNPGIAGSSDSAAGTTTVRGAGANIGGTTDQFQFAYLQAPGDIDIRVRVVDFQNSNPGAKAGLMIRESSTAHAKNAFVFFSDEQGVTFQWRSGANRKTAQASGPAGPTPVWLRLVRQGNLFSAYTSATGATWSLVGNTIISIGPTSLVGLAVTSRDPGHMAVATFSNLTFGASSSLPAPWAAQDIGGPAMTGSASESAGTFTVKGGGADIWDVSDQFQFVYQPVTGDTEIVARVASLVAADPWSKGGVMIRETLTAPAAHAQVLVTGSNGWAFQRRLVGGGLTYVTAAGIGAAPGWVRLVREGNLFSAYQSPDGSQWTFVGSDTIFLPATLYVGLAVTSHNVAATATGTFSNVAISTPTGVNKPPTVSLSAPLVGASFTAPATVAIAATAGDVDGSVTRVDFYAGAILVGSDTTSPFTATWSGVAAGTHSVTAVATDNDGATTISPAVTVTVSTAPNKPPTVSISGPLAGASYTAPANVILSATASDTDGTVARVDFYAGATLLASDAVSPFNGAWSIATAGTYSLTAVATDNEGGQTRSAAVTVSIAAAPMQPVLTTLLFGAPVDYATNVTSCTIELRKSGDSLTASAVATRNLGKPAAVSNEVSVNISTLVDPLPAGSYYGVVISTGPGGSTRSSASAVFLR